MKKIISKLYLTRCEIENTCTIIISVEPPCKGGFIHVSPKQIDNVWEAEFKLYPLQHDLDKFVIFNYRSIYVYGEGDSNSCIWFGDDRYWRFGECDLVGSKSSEIGNATLRLNKPDIDCPSTSPGIYWVNSYGKQLRWSTFGLDCLI